MYTLPQHKLVASVQIYGWRWWWWWWWYMQMCVSLMASCSFPCFITFLFIHHYFFRWRWHMQITRVGVVASCSFSCFLVFLICRIHSVAAVGRWRLMLHSHTTHKDSNTTLLLPGWSWPRHSHTGGVRWIQARGLWPHDILLQFSYLF